MTTRADGADLRGHVNLSWLLKLRWGAVAGQSVAIGIAIFFLHLRLPSAPLLALLALSATSNVALAAWQRRAARVSESVLLAVMALDILLLTCQLYLTGGPDNPFHVVYIIHIALAAVMLRAPLGWGVVALACTAFVTLWMDHVPFHDGARFLNEGLPGSVAQWGRAAAFALAATFVVHFVHHCTAALARTEAALASARELSARNEKLTSLATLAAGAAHELATPLATIAIVAKELERVLAPEAGGAREDARLIRQEVERCRRVLGHMAADAGESAGEPLVEVAAAQLVEEALAELPDRERVAVDIEPNARDVLLLLPKRSIAQAIRAAAKNGMEASPPGATVFLRVWATAAHCHVEVRDGGTGIAPEVLNRIGEPFFTTKGPGRGMGLGLFLTRTVLERLQGGLEVRSQLGQGSTIILTMPRSALAIA